MKKKINYRIATTLLICLAMVSSFSFTSPYGGEGYEIYINNKLVAQRFGAKMDQIETFSLHQYSSADQLTIKYYHCGRIGKGRAITIKDEKKHILKQWKYADVAEPVAGINCSMKELFAFEKTSGLVNVYYSSSELPSGRLIASFSPKSVAGNNSNP